MQNVAVIMEQVREHGITLKLVENKIQYFPKSAMPTDLVECIRERKAEIIECLRQENRFSNQIPTPEQIAGVLSELRKYLSPNLQKLDDEKLLALVNWNYMLAWNRMKPQIGRGSEK